MTIKACGIDRGLRGSRNREMEMGSETNYSIERSVPCNYLRDPYNYSIERLSS